MKHFYPDRSGLFQEDPSPNVQGMRSHWPDEEVDDVNLILWPLQSADLNPTEHRQETLDQRVPAFHYHHQNSN